MKWWLVPLVVFLVVPALTFWANIAIKIVDAIRVMAGGRWE